MKTWFQIYQVGPRRYRRTMTSAVANIWDSQLAVDQLDVIMKNTDDLDLVMAQIPGIFGESPKATYLGFRAVGLTPIQAMQVMDEDLETLEEWYEDTPWMRVFEMEKLPELQSRVGADIVRLGFLRNMTMFLFQDQTILRKSFSGLENMSSREYSYLKSSRRFYTTHDLLALEKAISPEKHRDQTLILSFGGRGYEVIEDSPDLKLLEESHERAD